MFGVYIDLGDRIPGKQDGPGPESKMATSGHFKKRKKIDCFLSIHLQ